MTDKSADKLLEGLNKEQAEAVTNTKGPLLIVAGAGTGKTTVITRKIAWLIDQELAKPEEILALTFTEKAAHEMEERVDQLLPYGFLNTNISTFHAFCESLLRQHGLEIGLPIDFKLLNESQAWLLLRRHFDQFNLEYYKPTGSPNALIYALLKHFSRLKDENILPDEYIGYAEKQKSDIGEAEYLNSDNEQAIEVRRVNEVAKSYQTYQKLLQQNSRLDFGDLILYSLKLLKERPQITKQLQKQYKYILVDEFQDTNYAQYELVKYLSLPNRNLTVVGDDDQSIYKFRGASFSNILKFREEFEDCHKVVLVQNYRSKQNILDLAYDFIQNNNPDRLEIQLQSDDEALDKKLQSAVEGQGVIEHLCFPHYMDEAVGVVAKMREIKSLSNEITWNDFVILARSNDALLPFIAELEKQQVDYIYAANRGLYRKPIVLDLISYFKLLDNYHESDAFYRILNLSSLQILPQTVIALTHYSRQKAVSLFEAARTNDLSQTLPAKEAEKLKNLLELIEKHTKLARYKSAREMVALILKDLGLYEVSIKTEQSNYLTAFEKRILQFMEDSDDVTLKMFLQNLRLEMEAGAQGELEVDLDAGPEAVKVMTVHSSKGLEYKYVFVVGLVDQRFPTINRKDLIDVPEALIRDILPQGEVHIQEERRLMYVAMTRAKDNLYLTRAYDYGGKRTKKPSRFLIELGLSEEEKSKAIEAPEIVKKEKSKFAYSVPKHFSFSHISTFRSCPLEYKYKYVLGLPLPGSSYLSFGQSIHRTFELFLREYQKTGPQGNLFSNKDGESGLPEFSVLQKYYEDHWVDDWYESKARKEDFRELGLEMLRTFYNECLENPPSPKYLEQSFRLKLGKYAFTGKIDRADETENGLVIIDYKTGKTRKLGKVDKEQLLIYQWATQEYLNEEVGELQYWYLRDNLEKISFLGDQEMILSLKEEYEQTIDDIVDCIEFDKFKELDESLSGHDCQYHHFES